MERKLLKLLVLLVVMHAPKFEVSGAYFMDQGVVRGSTISSACWTNPTPPQPTFPSENSFLNLSTVIFSWQPSQSSCPTANILYKVEIYSDAGLSRLYSTSDWQQLVLYPISDVPEGEYWWRIRVKDHDDNYSISQNFHFTVDRSSPTISLLINGSWTKQVEEKINNGNFETGNLEGWIKSGNVQVVNSDDEGNYMVKIGTEDDDGNWLWENRLMQSIGSGAKSLSLFYNFFSKDYSPYDDPGFLIRLNGQDVFKLNTFSVNPLDAADEASKNSGWQQFAYDLSRFDNQKINLAIYAGNTGDKTRQSWVYLDKITTYFVSASSTATYTLGGSDNQSGVNRLEYKIDDGNWIVGSSFNVSSGGTHYLSYRAVDNAGNSSPIHLVKIITDVTSPSSVVDLTANATENTITLYWTAPGNDGAIGRASAYDIRYKKGCTSESDFSFDAASRVDKVPGPQETGRPESLEWAGLNPDTSYCLGIKSGDEAPNWSNLSNVVVVNTLPGALINSGDVVINELMWMGSSVSPNDEWVELHNTTDRTIDLSGWKLTKDTGSGEIDMYVFPAGASVSSDGYIVVSQYDKEHSALKNSPDFVVSDTNFSLSDTHLDIKLYDSDANLLDVAWDETAPTEGLADGERFYSMERISSPHNGTNPLEWYTSIDESSRNDFFDSTADERGTPGAINRSENEPLAHSHLIPRTPLVTPPVFLILEPEINQFLVRNGIVSFGVRSVGSYEKLSHKLDFEINDLPQQIIGQVDLDGKNEFVKGGIVLGTCSEGGSCLFYENFKNLKLEVELVDQLGRKKNLTKDYSPISP